MRQERGALARKVTKGPGLYALVTAPEGAPAAAVGLLHGYADYAERYAHVVEAWAGRGIATVAIDMRGHGHAEGARGHCEHFSEYLDDTAELAHAVGEHFKDVPAALFGHSFGGLVAASTVLAKAAPWRALALTSPFFGVAMPVPAVKVFAGKIASRLVPGFAQTTGLHGSQLTHDAERARAYDADPLVFKTATARWFTETTAAQERAIARAPGLAMPLLLVAGEADPIVSIPRARAFFDAAGSKDKTWDLRPGLLHEVLNEPSWPETADRIADFVLAHAK
jgi:alpha-beta hydrolase superfamily lysophospholipase